MENQGKSQVKANVCRKAGCLIVGMFLLLVGGLQPNARAGDQIRGQIIAPLQITAETEPVLDMTISEDGQDIVYITGDPTASTLWLGSADPAVLKLPRKLTREPSGKRAPALSPDGDRVAYVDTRLDANGDIFLINLKNPDSPPVRLTNRDTADDNPAFAPNGERLYFQQAETDGASRLVVLDLSEPGSPPKPLETGGDSISAAVSPDGDRLAFVSFREHSSGDIFIFHRQTGGLRQITNGPAIDLFPAWGPSGARIYFSRIDSDTNQDGEVTASDNSVVCRIQVENKDTPAYPLTPLAHSAVHPGITADRLFYLSDRAGVTNCWSTPKSGRIPAMDEAEEQLGLARQIAGRIPYVPYLSLLAYYRVMETFPGRGSITAKAGCAIGRIYERLNLNNAARQAYGYVADHFTAVNPEGPVAKIQQVKLDGRHQIDKAAAKNRRLEILERTIRKIDRHAAEKGACLQAEAAFAKSRLIIDENRASAKILRLMKWLDPIIGNDQSPPAHLAQALFLKAEIYQQAGISQSATKTYRRLVKRLPDQRPWADSAVDRLLDLALADIPEAAREVKINSLRRMAEKNRGEVPILAMAALNRVGDLYYAAGDRSSAKSAYQTVIDAYDVMNTQAAAARFSLAEILYREERFRQALDLYEKEIDRRPATDRIYQLARNGYIRKTVSSGEFLYRLGEIPSARNTFKALIDYDDAIVEAHRGYIKCAAAAGDIEKTLADYRQRLNQNPERPLWLYTTGLALTYLETEEAVEEAKRLITRAVRLDVHVEYYHQSLGYIYEVSETVYGKTRQLEHALESYKKAYFLNDAQTRPDNAGNLELNLGNTFYLLGQYGKALEFYTKRLNRETAFSDPNTEIIFYKRLGECAFQARDLEASKTAYTRAIEKIDRRMAPLASAKGFDRMHRLVRDRILAPALKIPDLEQRAKKIANRQADISEQVAELARGAKAPPSDAWGRYKTGIHQLLDRQKKLNKSTAALARNVNAACSSGKCRAFMEDPSETLRLMTENIRTSLAFPEQLVSLKTEMTDRLGLVHQERQHWEAAIEAFERVYALNEKQGRTRNLARNRRAIAYNTYHYARTLTGAKRKSRLEAAAEEFRRALELVDAYGVPKPQKKEKQALIDISFQTSLDTAGATKAAHGFSEIQEKRLAEAFISRIHLELGEIEAARTHIDKQLAEYPIGDPVADNDRYGVALLYHRAGLLAHAMADYETALDRFEYSAKLCLKMRAPVSAALNMTNMAAAIEAVTQSRGNPEAILDAHLKGFQRLDREVRELLEKTAATKDSLRLANYHNTMGVAYGQMAELTAGRTPDQTPAAAAEAAVRRMNRLNLAAGHLGAGIRLCERADLRPTRSALETGARLHLNLAAVARRLGEAEKADKHFEKALEAAENGILPDLKWRALAGLDRLEKALSVLEGLTLARAGCRHMEIVNAFGPLVLRTLKEKNPEAAFNLAEHIAELERFNRTAESIRPHRERQKRFYKAVYPRLERIRSYKSRMADADPDKKPYIRERIEREVALLKAESKNPPDMIQQIADKDLRYGVMSVFGAAVHAEAIAAELATENRREPSDRDTLARLQSRYDELVSAYHEASNVTEKTRGPKMAYLMDFFRPRAAGLMDVIFSLGPEAKLFRIFPANPVQPAYVVFTVTAEGVSAQTARDLKAVKKLVSAAKNGQTAFIAYEDPAPWAPDAPRPRVLSGTHLYRCFSNRSPFKHHLLTVSETVEMTGLSDDFGVMAWKGMADRASPESAYALGAVNTLVMPHRLTRGCSVPTNAGQTAEPFLAVYTGDRTRLRLTELLSKTSSLTLSVISEPPAAEIDRIAHLFSLYGCPSLIILQAPFAEEASRIADLLNGYMEMTAFDASAAPGDPFRLTYLGDPGMTPEESSDFARKHFISYVKTGRAAFDAGHPEKALINIANAISIAAEIKAYSQYLPALYRIGRESAYRAGHLKKALALAQKLTDMLDAQQPDSSAHAEAMLTLGLIHAKLKQYDRAVPVIETAVDMFAMLDADRQLAGAMKNLGVVLENATRYDSALSRFQKAAALSKEIDDRRMLAAQEINIGRIYDLRLNRYPEAIRHYEKAMALYKAIDDPEKIAESRLNIGRCYRLLGVFAKAHATYENALATLTRSSAGAQRLKAKIIIEQANNAWFQGDFETAFKRQRHCHKLAGKTEDPLLRVMSKNTAGLIWWSLGNYDKALAELEIALKQARELDVRPDEVASTLNNIGLVYREMGSHEKALETFDQALAIDTELQSKWAMAYDYRNKGLTYLEMEQPKTAVPLFDDAYRLSDAIGNRINAAKARLGKGNALLALKDYEAAKAAYDQALTLSKDMQIKETRWRALYGLGRTHLALNDDRQTAETYFRDAIGIIESMRSAIKVKELKENFMKSRLDVYKDLVKLLADMEEPRAAFEIAERSRSRNFIDLLGTQQVALGSEVEAELYKKQATLAAEIEATEQLLAGAEAPEEVKAYREAVKKLKNERQNLMLDIQAEHPRLSTLISIPPVSADKIIRRLQADVALLSYYVLDEEILCWILRNPNGSADKTADIRLVRIPANQERLSRRVLEYRRIIQNLEPHERHSNALYDRLIAPIKKRIDDVHTVGIIPHGPLHYLSFATLYSGDDFLIDDFSLFYVPSASVLDYTLPRRIKRPKLQLKVLAIGNPDLGNPALELPFAEQEVGYIHWNFPEITTLTQDKATEAWVVKNIARFDIIHIASHGEFHPINPLMSAIKLSRAEDGKTSTDGDLRAAEVFGLDIRADMVCLSACQTGLGKVKAGDEIIGLNRSFFYAGTHTIISSLWRVSDVSTAMLIKTFYRRYTENNKADSLRAAARHVKDRYPHPGYWGAFTLVGDFK